MQPAQLFSIGEFSKITGLTVKTLRFYHEEGLLVPSCIDDQTGYRYYDAGKIEPARVITQLRGLEFSLPEIAEMMSTCGEEIDLLHFMERHREHLAAKVEHFRQIESRLDSIIRQQREARFVMKNATFEVEEKVVDPIFIAVVRMKGHYSECGKGFSQIARRWGRYIAGPCFLLHYDQEYKDSDADFEACFPLNSGAATAADSKKTEGISIRELPGGPCVSLLHKGPYEELGRSYEKIFKYVKSKGYKFEVPTREVYLRGPGMILKGNPKKYLTEIQLLLTPLSGSAHPD